MQINTETLVYTCPVGKKAFIYVDISTYNGSIQTITIKINNLLYWTGEDKYVSIKLALTEGDTVKVGTNSIVNVFVHGMEV